MIKYFFALVIALHGLIHFIGFAKAFNYVNITQITKVISKSSGLLWLLATILFLLAVVLFLLKNEYWPMATIVATIVSQILIIIIWKDAKFGTLINVLALLCAIPSFAEIRFNNMSAIESKTILARIPNSNTIIITKEMLNGLPAVVQKWLTHTGIIGKEQINTVRLKQNGEMRTKPDSKWMPFTAAQYFTVNEPAFVWIADVKMMPLINLIGRDKFENGHGEMLIKLLSLYKVAYGKDNEKINSATMIRYLAETSWFPTSALSEYIHWEEIDSLSAKAIFTFNGIKVSGIFKFNEHDDMVAFESNRYYGTDDKATLEKWVVENVDWKDF